MSTADSWLTRAAGWCASAADGLTGTRLSTLIFHRVLAAPDPLFPEEVDAARFEKMVRLVARGFTVLPLGEAVARRAAGDLPARALTITFDDGYADNAEVALPILQRHGLSATFFITTGFLDGGRMFNDTVIECLRAARVERIDLTRWGLGSRPLTSALERRSVINALLPKAKYLPLEEREQFLAQLIEAAGNPTLPTNLMMRSDQVKQLHHAGMEIGGHTVRHPILRLLPDSEAEAEIAEGRSRLQQLTGAPVDVFAYPNGRPMQDYDARHVAMVRRLGFRGAVSTAQGVASSKADPFQLPRFTPWDRNGARWLGRLMHARITGSHYDQVTAA